VKSVSSLGRRCRWRFQVVMVMIYSIDKLPRMVLMTVPIVNTQQSGMLLIVLLLLLLEWKVRMWSLVYQREAMQMQKFFFQVTVLYFRLLW
jgi:hypothetical protein